MEGNHDLKAHNRHSRHIGSIVDYCLGMASIAKAQEEQMCAEFKERAEETKKKYWDACKYPRKTKKRMRKEAIKDYELYMILAKPFLFKF